MKIIISESQLNKLMESTSITNQEYYSIFVGFLVQFSDDLGSQKTIELLATIKELRIYYENLRDGIQPKQLSLNAKKMNDWVKGEIKKQDSNTLYQLRELGMNVKTT